MRTDLQNIILFLIAIFLTFIIFIADLKSPPNLAMGVLYTLVILYTWLLPGKSIVLISGSICSFLIIIAAAFSDYPIEEDRINGINPLFALISTWVCVAMISLAKRSLNELQEVIGKKELKVDEKTREILELNYTLEEKVANRTAELAQTNQELKQFAYVASHDLLEPVNTIKSFTTLIDEEGVELSSDVKSYLSHIKNSSERMSELISDLLDYSRLGREGKFTELDLNSTLQQVQDDLSSSIKESNTSLNIQDLPMIVGLEVEIRLLFQNLISNAIKFRKKDVAPKVEIKCQRQKNHWKFVISDNGIGIQDKYKNRIFTIFKRLHTAEQYEGTGIGLAHCKKIVELHQGKIWIESTFGEGSSVFFTLKDLNE